MIIITRDDDNDDPQTYQIEMLSLTPNTLQKTKHFTIETIILSDKRKKRCSKSMCDDTIKPHQFPKNHRRSLAIPPRSILISFTHFHSCTLFLQIDMCVFIFIVNDDESSCMLLFFVCCLFDEKCKLDRILLFAFYKYLHR